MLKSLAIVSVYVMPVLTTLCSWKAKVSIPHFEVPLQKSQEKKLKMKGK